MTSRDSSPRAPQRQRKWLYPLLLALETAGAFLLYREGLPLYRELLANPAAYNAETTGVALGGAVLIQCTYWTRYRIRLDPPRLANAVLAHVVLFVSRLIFILPTAIFSFLFISKSFEIRLPASKYAFLFFALFSLFCYVSELERLAQRMLPLAGPDR